MTEFSIIGTFFLHTLELRLISDIPQSVQIAEYQLFYFFKSDIADANRCS